MATKKQVIINKLKTERAEEFQGSNLELYLDIKDVLDEKDTLLYDRITKADRTTILNKWVQKRTCPVDTSYKYFRYIL